jgi:hypoxanthine-guanine phosphoribosyltransferase
MEKLRMKILFSRDEIDRVVREMAQRISRDYEGKDLGWCASSRAPSCSWRIS